MQKACISGTDVHVDVGHATCVSCHWHDSGWHPTNIWTCQRPEAVRVDLVTGLKRFPTCERERLEGACGTQGRYWEERS